MEEEKKVLKEVKEIQKDCAHKEGYVVKFLSDTSNVRRFCGACNQVIGYPSEQELKDNNFK